MFFRDPYADFRAAKDLEKWRHFVIEGGRVEKEGLFADRGFP
jgi:hypothetical protein